MAMTGDWKPAEAERAMGNVECSDQVPDLESLPSFFTHNVLNPRGEFAGVRLLIIDSLQGDGVASNAARKYARFYEFVRAAKSAGITVMAIGHVNKRGQLGGPKDLEHFVDAVWRVEKVADFRICAVTKNRFGAEKPRGIPLLIDPKTTALRPSPHIEPVTGSARTFLGGNYGEAELQASLSLPMPGMRPQIMAPGLPRRRIEQIVLAITRVPMLNLDQFDLNVGALLPGEVTFKAWMGLPLSIALISSCIRRAVPQNSVFLGEIDLNRQVRPLPINLVGMLTEAISDGRFTAGTRLFVSPASAEELPQGEVQIVPCDSLDTAVALNWSDLNVLKEGNEHE